MSDENDALLKDMGDWSQRAFAWFKHEVTFSREWASDHDESDSEEIVFDRKKLDQFMDGFARLCVGLVKIADARKK